MLLQKIKGKIDEARSISFDVFDTLVIRIYDKPTDLFKHLEESKNAEGFYFARITAESLAREKAQRLGKKEITLDQIYEEIHVSYKPLKVDEIMAEYMACKVNPEMKKVYDYALRKGKEIIIASDMYLPKDVIENILANCGYNNFSKLYVSSDIGDTKISGGMFDKIISDCGVEPEDIFHIGDNSTSDVMMARKSGINAYLYNPFCENYGTNINDSYVNLLRKYSYKSVVPSIVTGLTANVEYDWCNSYWYKFGYKYAGILVYGYAKWLKQQFDKDGIEKVFFMLRDGYITKKAMELMYPELKTQFVFGSRRLFLLAGLDSIDDILVYLTKSFTDGLNYREIYDRVMFDDEELLNEYKRQFPNQNEPIISKEQLKKIETFFRNQFKGLERIGEKERELLTEYLTGIGIIEGKNAVVDLGWRGSMLTNIEKICKKENKQCNLMGYYVATHPNKSNARMLSFIMNNGKPDNILPYSVFATSAYVMNIIELIFSAPHPSIVKLEKKYDKIAPIYQQVTEAESTRMRVFNEICNGTLDFIRDFKEIDNQNPIEVSPEVCAIPMEYFANSISKYDAKQIAKIDYVPGIGNDSTSFPINKNTKFTIGLVNPWEGAETAEAEAIKRIERAAEAAGVVTVKLSTTGKILDSNFNEYPDYVCGNDLDCAITFNYETYRCIDTFYYHTIWSPPEMSLGLEDYVGRLSDNILMNDDYLLYDFGGMTKHLQAILGRKQRDILDASSLTASFPSSSLMKPNIDDPYIFYCGMNWEKINSDQGRHDSLFKLLDQSEKVKFYGPNYVESWGGINPWEGYNCYQKPIPFDGFTILNEINRCGICLVISSDIHRRAGAVTNRTYEACAAGAIMISDENPWMLHYFKDAALFINYNKNDPQDTFNQIMDKYKWVIEHKKEAEEIVRKAQKIFCEKFALEKQLRDLAHNHTKRFEMVENNLFAQNNEDCVLVTYVVNTLDPNFAKNSLDVILSNIENQYYRNIMFGVVCDFRIFDEISSYLSNKMVRYKLISEPLYDKKGSKEITDGLAIKKLLNRIQHSYLINTNENEVWLYDHLTTLIRTLEDNPNAVAAYSGRLQESEKGLRLRDYFDCFNTEDLYNFDMSNVLATPGQIIFRSNEEDNFDDFIFSYIDGLEHYALAFIKGIRDKKEMVFSHRMTMSYKVNTCNNRILNKVMQVRFLQDIVKDVYKMEFSKNEATYSRDNTVMETRLDLIQLDRIFMDFPIRSWFKVKYYRMRLRRAKFGSSTYAKIKSKYDTSLDLYMNQIKGIV